MNQRKGGKPLTAEQRQAFETRYPWHGQMTYIPAFDANGKQWTMQYIHQDGTKRFAKDSKKEGCFHPVGGMEALAAAPALVISEGFATAASNAAALRFATVAASDSGNMDQVCPCPP